MFLFKLFSVTVLFVLCVAPPPPTPAPPSGKIEDAEPASSVDDMVSITTYL